MNLVTPTPPDKARPSVPHFARRWLEEFGQVALATVVSTWGSSPVPVGGQLAIAPDESFEGSVSGGCVEASVIVEAASVMQADKPALLSFGVSDESAWAVGLPCGGNIQILIEPLRRERDAEFLDQVLAVQTERRPLFVETEIATGTRRWSNQAPAQGAIAEAAASGRSGIVEGPDGKVFLHCLLPEIRLIVTGATHIAQYLADLAGTIGYSLVVIDPRSAFASGARFGSHTIVNDWPQDGLEAIGLDTRTALVMLSHIADIDDEALIAGLRSPCLYLGALGSKRTHEARLARLRQQGFSDQELARIHAPIGLPIGAVGPAEIAVSILAEIVSAARGRT